MACYLTLLGLTVVGFTILTLTARSRREKHRLPMVIFDGKGDREFFYDLLPHAHLAGRLHHLRVLNPARPDISVRYNPFYCSDENYMSVVNMVFGSFNLHTSLPSTS